MRKIQTIFDQMNEDKMIQQSFLKLGMRQLMWLRSFSTFMAFLMNFMFIYSYYWSFQYKIDGNQGKMKKKDLEIMEISKALFVLKISQICASILSLLLFLKNRSRIIFLEYWRNRFFQLKPAAKAQKSKKKP